MTAHKITTAALILIAFFLLPGHGCENHLIDDSGFQLWCGEELCAWSVEKGEVDKAPTWHPDDFGVELVGDSVALSQFSDQGGFPCIRFAVVADIQETTAVTLELDLDDDGTVDISERLPTSDWEPLVYLLPTPTSYTSVLFRLRKEGAGHAVLAQIEATSAEECQ